MLILEKAHNIKRYLIKTYQKYFTIQHPENYILSDKSFIKKLYKKNKSLLDLYHQVRF
mgnify:CR=1 FL=1